MEERRLTEKRTFNVDFFDNRPAVESSIDEVNLEVFQNVYLPNAVSEETLDHDERNVEEQMASLRFYSLNYQRVTNAGLLLFGENIKYHFPGAFIQYVRFAGRTIADDITEEREFSDNLYKLLPDLEKFIEYSIVKKRPLPAGALREDMLINYPQWALRELLMNAIMHRDYESNTPVKFYQYDDRIEIVNPGGLFGNARPENFPGVNDYRNPVIAEAMKVLGYVNRFNRGIERVKVLLKKNKNPQPRFEYNDITVFKVIVYDAIYKKIGRYLDADSELSEKEKTVDILIELIKKHPEQTMSFFANNMGLSERGINYHFEILKAKGILKREGGRKFGKWIIDESKIK